MTLRNAALQEQGIYKPSHFLKKKCYKNKVYINRLTL